MGTSRSREGEWIAGASLFSGRRDPSWPVRRALARSLLRLWDALPPGGTLPGKPPLGYRGCSLRAPDGGEWHAFEGAVSSRSGGGAETRRDVGRAWERRLLATAPPGLLPPDLSI